MHIFQIWSLNPKILDCTQSLAGQLSPILALKLLLFKCKGYISFDQASVRFYKDITSNIKNTVRDNALSLNIFDTYFQIC